MIVAYTGDVTWKEDIRGISHVLWLLQKPYNAETIAGSIPSPPLFQMIDINFS